MRTFKHGQKVKSVVTGVIRYVLRCEKPDGPKMVVGKSMKCSYTSYEWVNKEDYRKV